jgi:hypothetical protein
LRVDRPGRSWKLARGSSFLGARQVERFITKFADTIRNA